MVNQFFDYFGKSLDYGHEDETIVSESWVDFDIQ